MVQKPLHDLSFQPDLSFTTFSLHHSLCWSLPRKLFPSILVAHFFSSFMSLLKWHVVNDAFPDRSMRWQCLALAIHVHLACMYVKLLQSFQLFITLCTIAGQAPLSMGFSRQEYWSGLPCPPPGNLPGSGVKPTSLVSPMLAARFFTISATQEAPLFITTFLMLKTVPST